jgi:pimeloyl-ACP methyl ester carboxylesterase
MPFRKLRTAAFALAALAALGAAGRPPAVAAARPPIVGQPAPAPVQQGGDPQMVAVGDAELAYRVLGQGEPLLLIQGFRATMDDWDPTLLDALAAHYLVVVFDNRGMGRSTAPAEPFDIRRLTDDAAGLLAALGLARVSVMGYSMGGFIAQELALAYPERVQRLILLSTSCGGAESVPISPAVWAALDATGGSAAEQAQRLIGVLLPADWLAANQAYLQRLAARPREPAPAATIARQRQAIEDWTGTCERLPTLRLPALVLVGVEDEALVPANGVQLAERIPGAWLVQFAGGGHGMMYQYPRQLAATIGLFLSAP